MNNIGLLVDLATYECGIIHDTIDDMINFVGQNRIVDHRYASIFHEDIVSALRSAEWLVWQLHYRSLEQYCNFNRHLTFLIYFGYDIEREIIRIDKEQRDGLIRSMRGREKAKHFREMAKTYWAHTAKLAQHITEYIREEQKMLGKKGL